MADEKTCPRCAETVKAAAVVCRFCGYDFLTGAAPPPQPARSAPAAAEDQAKANSRSTGCGLAILLFLVLAAIVQCDADESTTATDTAAIDAAAALDASPAPSADVPPPPPSNWSYTTSEDKVRGGKSQFAWTSSTNTVDFDFPYNGGSRLDINIRRRPSDGLTAYLTIDKGQMLCDVNDGCYAMVRFDGGKARRFSMMGPSDYSSETVFIEDAETFLNRLRKSKTAVVELEFYQAGRPQFEFNTAGLEWPPKS